MLRQWAASILSGCLLLAACGGGGGGGGGGGDNRPAPTYTVGGTVSGLTGSVSLQNNGGAEIAVGTNGTFSIASGVTAGTAYSVAVSAHPELQSCDVVNGSGTANGNVSNITVTCADIARPALSLTVQQIKKFRFDWTLSPGITRYRLLEDASGNTGFTQVGTDLDSSVSTTFDLGVSLHRRLNARYILQACGASRCIDSLPVSVSGNLAASIGYLKPTPGIPLGLLGADLAISADGTTLAVQAGGEHNIGSTSGVVYLFRRVGLGWLQEARLEPLRSIGEFGGALSLSADGSVLAVGAPGDDNGDVSLQGSGAVHVYSRDGAGIWTRSAFVSAINGQFFDEFGCAVALSADGRTLAVGARGEDSNATGVNGNAANNDAAASGAAYIYELTNSGNWTFRAYIKASNTGAGDSFGWALALSADGATLAVGAYGEDASSAGNGETTLASGATYVYTKAGANWSQSAYLKATNAGSQDLFGRALALSADGAVLAVGAPGEASNATGINGNSGNDASPNAGAAYVFVRSGTDWAQQAYVKADNTDADDGFGAAIALSADGATLAVGAHNEDGATTGLNVHDNVFASSAGATYVFASAAGAWAQQAYVKAWNTGGADSFGYSVALSADGGTLAVGAIGEDSARVGTVRAVPDNDDNSASNAGAVYLY
jgi:trimeric autotransporter adhesin